MKLSLAFLAVLAVSRTLEVGGVPLSDRRNSISSKGLHDDLDEFLQLIPKDKIVDLVYQYIDEDEDFGEAIDYIMSDDFKDLITEIESFSEVRELLNFLQNSGLDAYAFINKINALLGIEIIQPKSQFSLPSITGGLPGFIKDVKALLPVEEIKKLYNEKLKTSPAFAELVKRLSSEEFQGLVDKLIANSKLQDLIKRAEAKGVDVQAILDFISSVLGLKFPERPAVFVTRDLKEDLNDFLKLVPTDKIVDLFYQYLAEDEDFGEAIDYIMSDEFKALITEIESFAEVRELLNFLQDSGLDAYGFINKINDILGIEHITPLSHFRFPRITGGLPGFIKDVKALLPVVEIEKLYNEKLKTSADFAELVKRLSSEEFQGLVDKLMANSKLQELMKRAEAKGVDVQAILDFISSVLGLKFPERPVVFVTRDLKEDLNDFLKLIPKDKIVDLFYQYLAEDEDFGEALDYIMSDEFKVLITEIESFAEVRELLNFLQDSGLDAYGFINKINDLLGIEHITPLSHFKFPRITGGLPGFIKDVKALLPVDEIEKLYNEKLKSSADFAELVKRLSSKEFQGLVDKLMANSKLQELMKRAEAKGVDVQAILDFISSVLGLKFPERPAVFVTRDLKEDLNDFLKLVPTDKIVDLFYQYLAEDEDFGEAIDYIMSDEFKALITEIESFAEVRELLNFLQDSGLDAYGFINKINDILGIEHITPLSHFRFPRITGGLPGFIKDVKALLPVDEIEKLYNEKLKTSADFAKLVKRLSSEEFQGLVDKLMANSKLQELMKRAEAKGVDVQAILDFISSVLGLKFPERPVLFLTRDLKEDLNDFLKLVPTDKIVDLFYQYLAEDEDFGEAIDYIMSDEFKSLITEIESFAEVRELLNFLQDSGLDAYGFINKINDILGIEHITPLAHFRFSIITGGLPGFIKDVKALLPVEEIEKLYNEKLKTSADFAELVKRLSSEEFQGLVDKLMANSKLQELMKRAEAKGVDVQAILDFISSVLGLKFPERPIFTKEEEEEVIDILRVIWSKVPIDDLFDIIVEYLVQDEDFKKVVKFMLSDEFKKILVECEDLPEIRALLKYLHEIGMDIYNWLNEFHGLIGLEKTLPLSVTYTEITGGIPGLIKDIRAILPLDELYAYYDEKLETSKKFKEFVTRLEKHELQNAVDALGEHKGFNILLDRLEALGVDLNAVTEIISAIIGIKFPQRPF